MYSIITELYEIKHVKIKQNEVMFFSDLHKRHEKRENPHIT